MESIEPSLNLLQAAERMGLSPRAVAHLFDARKLVGGRVAPSDDLRGGLRLSVASIDRYMETTAGGDDGHNAKPSRDR